MATISVTGSAHRSLRPERGTARVLVHVEGARREDVAPTASALHDRLTTAARRFVADDAATEWSADQVWVSTIERYRGEKRAPERVALATASVRVTFVDLDALSRWLGELAEQDGVELHGIEWSLSDGRRRALEGEMRAEAVLDALARAREYASALGLDTVELVGLYEPGLRPGRELDGVQPYAARELMASPPSGELTVRPQDLEVRAEVTADFRAG